MKGGVAPGVVSKQVARSFVSVHLSEYAGEEGTAFRRVNRHVSIGSMSMNM